MSWASFLRLLAIVAAVWLWLRLWQWLLLFVVAVCLAVALDPAVEWLARRRIRRAVGAPALVLLITVLVALFVYVAGASLVEQGRFLGGHINDLQRELTRRLPASIVNLLPRPQAVDPRLSTYAARLGSALINAAISFAIALVVTVYLLLDGRRTYAWLAAFAPASQRERVDRTARAARAILIAYVRGNVITSVLCAIVTWIALAALKVPAALLLAVLAGVCDFIPVVGFFISGVPTVLLALTVSPLTAIGATIFYVAYNTVENYYISPKVYGRELSLSDLAVIAVFAVGAELGGVLGALIALPLAALYPVIEEIWLADRLGEDVAAAHRRIESDAEE